MDMVGFPNPLLVSPLPDGKNWVVVEPFCFNDNDGFSEHVSAGFVTDFASIPRVFWVILPKWDKYGYAAVIHDWLYWKQPNIDGKNAREYADLKLLHGMEASGVGEFKKALIFKAVRWFGFFAWYRNRIEAERGYNRVIGVERTRILEANKRSSQYLLLGHYLLALAKDRLFRRFGRKR
jgi:hypothetical protein